MTELSMRDLAEKQVDKLSEQRRRNRENFPNAAMFMDIFAIFKPKLVWAEEGGQTIGVTPDWAKERGF